MQQLGHWHQTKPGLMAFAVVELVLAYCFVSWAIDSGRLLAYFLTLICFIGFMQNLVKFIARTVRHGY